MVDFINEVQSELSQEVGNDLLNITTNIVLESLVELGVLTELDQGIGYNGITVPKGISNNSLADLIEDKITETLQKRFEHAE